MGELAPPRTACSRAGGGYGMVSPPDEGVGGITPGIFFAIFDAKSAFGGNLGQKINSSRVNLTSTT